MSPIFGILLALACALATNVGFLFKHRGACAAPAVDIRQPAANGPIAVRLAAVRDRHADRRRAPGSSTSRRWRWRRCRSSRRCSPAAWCCWRSWPSGCSGCRSAAASGSGIGLTAVGLMLLGFSLPAVHGAHSRFSVPGMIAFEAGLLVAGTLLIMGPRIGAPPRAPRLHARRRRRHPVRRLRRRDQGDLGHGRRARRPGSAQPLAAGRRRRLGRAPSTPRPRACRTATRSR